MLPATQLERKRCTNAANIRAKEIAAEKCYLDSYLDCCEDYFAYHCAHWRTSCLDCCECWTVRLWQSEKELSQRLCLAVS